MGNGDSPKAVASRAVFCRRKDVTGQQEQVIRGRGWLQSRAPVTMSILLSSTIGGRWGVRLRRGQTGDLLVGPRTGREAKGGQNRGPDDHVSLPF